MVRKREPNKRGKTQSIEEFTGSIEGQPQGKSWEGMDPNAPRYKEANPDSKSVRYPMNEYEYLRLQAAAKASGRTMMNYIRWSVNSAVDDELS